MLGGRDDGRATLPAMWEAISALAQAGLLLAALGTLLVAWTTGLIPRLIESERRRPQIGVQLVTVTPQDNDTTPIPESQLPGHLYWLREAFTRDSQDWSRYPKQKHWLVVDNVGTGPAVRVSVRYKVTAYDVDAQTPPTWRPDPTNGTHEGVFEVLHVNAGAQKYAPIHIDTTYFPAYKIEWFPPEIRGLDNLDYSAQWTDLGAAVRVVEKNNRETWDSLRSTSWAASRASSITVTVNGVQPTARGLSMNVLATASSAHGAVSSKPIQVFVTDNASVALGPFYVFSGNPLDVDLPRLASGAYLVTASADGVSASTSLHVP